MSPVIPELAACAEQEAMYLLARLIRRLRRKECRS